ncbi:uxuA [Symbiodinium natans]|uniref:UxuA protein n=1 Tax=Symbiodinium natans TaxID=878477 RepID=A0A812Q7P8_9DINO|nr:uxuA [Symbiodinium natans]
MRPDFMYRVNALQQCVTIATVETMKEANRVVALALGDADRSIVFRIGISPWGRVFLAVVTFCDASFAAEPGYKSQRGRLHYLSMQSLTDHLLIFVSRPMEDKRLAIEMTALRQALWVDDTPTSEAFIPFGDILRWIPTQLQLADCLTKSMKPKLLNDALASNEAIIKDEAPTE